VELSAGERLVGRIPVRNLWLLMLYASELTRFKGEFSALVEADCNELPALVAGLLAKSVERRLKRNLTSGYCSREKSLTRVRGRINILITEANLLLDRGEVFCHFHELSINTPRNRLVRAALDLMARIVQSDELAYRCRSLAAALARSGVGGLRPSRADLALDQIGRNDAVDRFMVALAQLAFDLALPTEESGRTALVAPDREEIWVRRLFEKAILGFARVELEPLGWRVRGGVPFQWQVSCPSEGIPAILPQMVTDIILYPPGGVRPVIVDTKFSSILEARRFGGASLKSRYLYQMYAYVRSQEGIGLRSYETAGLFLHPAIAASVGERAVIQGHSLTFATVDLSASAAVIRKDLRGIFLGQLS